MAQRLALLMLATAGLGGCSQAGASTVDPSNDTHCSVVAFYFNGHPATQAAPRDQREAIAGIARWYAAKVRALAAEQGGDTLRQIAEPVLEAVKNNADAHREHLVACTDRAVEDPNFKAWLRGR